VLPAQGMLPYSVDHCALTLGAHESLIRFT